MIYFKNKEIEDSKYRGKLIVIDPGHGGKDPGAHSNNLKLQEKQLVLDTAKRLEKLLREAGFDTYLTRDDDTYVGLYERAGIANGLNADAFVSIHYNWHPDKNISGVLVIYNQNDPIKNSKPFAEIMLKEMEKELHAVNRGLMDRPKIVVTRETQMPAVLAELAFLSNEREESLVATEAYRQRCAQALYNGIKRYFDEVVLKQ